ncbi:hypothetical protein [Sphingomonas sp. MMS24-J13]|uniref:hypothetical protein n=1 Tax=Sphingomonas sp. MMS24-J13 TaxID=3238686 RepID=UPI00384CD4F2
MRTWRIKKEAVRLAAEPNALALAKQQIDGATALQDTDGIRYWTDVWYKIQEIKWQRNDVGALGPTLPAAVQVRLIMKALSGVSNLDRPMAILATGLGLALVMLFDWLSGAECDLLVAYLVVVGFASWTVNDRAGAAVAFIATGAVGLMLHIQRQGLPIGYAMSGTTEAWNLFVHFSSLLLFAGVVGALRAALDRGPSQFPARQG